MDITTLPVQQLQQVRESMEQEIQVLTGSYGTLKTAQAKFNTSLSAMDTLRSENKDKVILVPLSGSLYVPGKFSNVEKVIVDIGTGYYAEKGIKDAQNYYFQKVEFLKTNIDQLQQTLVQKQKQYNIVIEVLQMNIAAQDRESSNSGSK